jgi:hypothetical protein
MAVRLTSDPVPRRRIAALIAAAALAAPSSALAQSAGDEQYQDPFGGDGQSQSQTPSASGGTAQATPTPAPAPAPAAAPTAVPVETSPAAQQLPRTGGDPELPAIAGALLLAGGVALRVRLRPR